MKITWDNEEITEDWLDKMDMEYKNSWRWKHIDRFFPRGFDGYNISYFVTKPWEFPKSCYRHMRWACQRLFRGWDDRIVWSIDDYLAKMIPIWIRQLKNNQIGYPMTMYDDNDFIAPNYKTTEDADKRAIDKWNNILNQIAEGFDAYTKIDEESLYPNEPEHEQEYKELFEKYQTGFKLFQKHFQDLWD